MTDPPSSFFPPLPHRPLWISSFPTWRWWTTGWASCHWSSPLLLSPTRTPIKLHKLRWEGLFWSSNSSFLWYVPVPVPHFQDLWQSFIFLMFLFSQNSLIVGSSPNFNCSDTLLTSDFNMAITDGHRAPRPLKGTVQHNLPDIKHRQHAAAVK